LRDRHPVNAGGKPPIDNNPTPSYLSLNLGRLSFAGLVRVEFAEKCRISGAPEA
jgi:hypothetical protein